MLITGFHDALMLTAGNLALPAECMTYMYGIFQISQKDRNGFGGQELVECRN